MLSVNFANVRVQGSKIGIMAELSTLVNSLYTRDILTKEDIEYSIKIALLSENELKEKAEALEKETREEVKKKLDDEDEDDSSKEEAIDDIIEALKVLFN